MKGEGEVRKLFVGILGTGHPQLPARPPRYRFQCAGSAATLPVSRAVALGSIDRSLTGPNGSSRGGESPEPGTAKARRYFVACWPAALTTSTSPSAVHPVTRVCGSPQKVSRAASPPAVSEA